MDHIGRYRLVRRVGSGAFATVWLAHDDELDVPVAVKVLADNWSHRQDIRERFLYEARLLRRIEDERAVRVYDIGELDDGRPYFVMDYADQGSLEDQMRDGPLELIPAVRHSAQAARALSALHRYGVVHRDVTPGNLLLRTGSDGSLRLVIADLGMAKALAEASGLTQVAGTPAYMAPEQARGDGGFDERADVYAVAAVAYTLLTGRPPYEIKDVNSVATRDPRERPLAPSALRSGGLPAPVDAVVLRALSYDPNSRWRSAEEFANALDSALAEGIGPVVPHRPAPGTTTGATMRVTTTDPGELDLDEAADSPAKKRLVWAGLAVGSATLMIVGFYAGWLLVS